jgi:hypothetical protein
MQPVWSNAPPTKPGWYWQRNEFSSVWIGFVSEQMLRHNCGSVRAWWGPIPVPVDPKDPQRNGHASDGPPSARPKD